MRSGISAYHGINRRRTTGGSRSTATRRSRAGAARKAWICAAELQRRRRDLPAPVRRRQPDAVQLYQAEHQDQRNEAAVEGDLDRRMRGGSKLDADAHAGEQQAGNQHPEGLHRRATQNEQGAGFYPDALCEAAIAYRCACMIRR